MSESIPRSLPDTTMKKMCSRKEKANGHVHQIRYYQRNVIRTRRPTTHPLLSESEAWTPPSAGDEDSRSLLAAMHTNSHFEQQIRKNISSIHGANTVLFNTYLKELKTSPWMLITALFITAKLWKPPRYHSDNREINTKYLDHEISCTIKKELDRYKAMK